MSLRAVQWALKTIREVSLKPSSSLTLIALADLHHQETGRCNPRIAVIAERAGLSVRAVRYGIRELEEKGVIRVIFRRTRKGSKRLDLPNEFRFRSWAKPPARFAPHPLQDLQPELGSEGSAQNAGAGARPSDLYDLVIDPDYWLEKSEATASGNGGDVSQKNDICGGRAA